MDSVKGNNREMSVGGESEQGHEIQYYTIIDVNSSKDISELIIANSWNVKINRL